MKTMQGRAVRKSGSFLWMALPIAIVFAWMVYRIAERSWQITPAQVVTIGQRLVDSAPSGGNAPNRIEMRSQTHSFQELPPSRQFLASYPHFRPHLIAAGEKEAWYTRDANQILCSLPLSKDTWLGTVAGVKRLDYAAKTVRHYTAADGLPSNGVVALAGREGEIYCCTSKIVYPAPYVHGNETLAHSSYMALCRLHNDSGLWETLVEEVRNFPYGSQVDCPTQMQAIPHGAVMERKSAERTYIAVGGDHVCLVL